MKKKVGILLPIFALPNKYGIGTLGKEAFQFVDFLYKSKQNLWQLLPTNPTSFGDSPYQSFSVFAQNHYFIDLELLVEDGLLSINDLESSYLKNNSNQIDYGNVYNNKNRLLEKAYDNHQKFLKPFNKFKKDNSSWLDYYSLFMVLKKEHNGASWESWEDCYRLKKQEAINKFKKDFYKEIDTVKFIQFLYYKQYKNLLSYAHKKDIELIGDMPIYVAYDSADVWQNPQMFLLDQWLKPCMVAGVPPDYFSSTGQLWGNPIYNWDAMKNDNYLWWINRINNQLKQTDYVRIDHFRGFSAFYAIPYGNKDATVGTWLNGPNMDLFDMINKKLNHPKIIAENLGLLDENVYSLIEKTKYPGMRIMEFEMYSKDNIEKVKKMDPNNIFYPGTHDNNTFISWFEEEASQTEKQNLLDEFNVRKDESLIDALIRYTYEFPFNYAIIAMQDILGLDKKARFNTPGVASGNWAYMFSKEDFSKELSDKLARYVKKYIK